jgi:hypothetical protein
MTTRFDGSFACLDCGKGYTTGTLAAGAARIKPQPGDPAICFECGHLMVFVDDTGQLRAPTDAEIIDFAGDEAILEAQKLLAFFRAARNFGKELEGKQCGR